MDGMKSDEVKAVTVVGMGTMGPDIALGFALGGYRVTGVDLDQAVLSRAINKIDADCEQMREWGLAQDSDLRRARQNIVVTLAWDEAVGTADYVMEAVPELLDVKKKVLKRVGDVSREEVVIASNTSTMDVTEIAADVRAPERVLGTHWFIPAHLMPPVEVIPGAKTTQSTIDVAFGVLRKANKLPVLCKNHPGFIHNYVQYAMVGAALQLVEKGIASPAEIDTVVENGFALRLSSTGPFKSMDMTGLDAAFNVFKYLYEHTGQAVYAPSSVLDQKIKNGQLGHKTGEGFFRYTPAQAETARTHTNKSVAAVKKVLGSATGSEHEQ
jgi:3-hydroxybutyryl-CoA dehydrogenase